MLAEKSFALFGRVGIWRDRMSRIGEQPVEVPAGVTVSVAGATVSVKGANGDLSLELPGKIQAEASDGKVVLSRPDDSRESKSTHGLARSLVANMVEGVSKGFSKKLEIEGVGFKAAIQGQALTMMLGFSSPVEYTVPEGVTVTVDGGTKVLVASADKQKVGDCAARIKSFFPVEPYKGKGIRYSDEHVRRKVGKTVA